MSAGLDIIWDNLIHSEKRKFCTSFLIPDSEEIFAAVKQRLAREGTRVATAGEKLVGLFISEYAPNPLFIGEFIAFFTSNSVMTAYVTDFLELPFEYRPGVNPLRLGDLFFAFIAMGCQSHPEVYKTVATLDILRFNNAKQQYFNVIAWLLDGKQISEVTVEELRRAVQVRAEKSQKERKEKAQQMVGASISCDEYNAWHRSRCFPVLTHQHPVVRLRYMTRSGQERQIFACLCCAAVEPKDCICPREQDVVEAYNMKNKNAATTFIASTIFRKDAIGAEVFEKQQHQQQTNNSRVGLDFLAGFENSSKNNNNNNNNIHGNDDEGEDTEEIVGVGTVRARPPASKSAYPSSHDVSKPVIVTNQERYHTGIVEECRMTKTKALKVQNIAVWTCCGAEAAKVNTTPIGYEVFAEKMNGCQGPGAPR